jgi:hypothetical protein
MDSARMDKHKNFQKASTKLIMKEKLDIQKRQKVLDYTQKAEELKYRDLLCVVLTSLTISKRDSYWATKNW